MKKKYRISCFLLCMLFLFLTPLTVGAQSDGAIDNSDIIISPQMAYIATFSSNISISSDVATATTSITGYPTLATKVKIEMTLEKKGFLGLYWTEVNSWSQTWNTYYGVLEKQQQISGGTYRVKGVFTAWNGSTSETYTGHSQEAQN